MSEHDEACRACASPTSAHQTVRIRGAEVALHRCADCGLFEFPDPGWLAAAYSDPISEIDTGLPARCFYVAQAAEAIIRAQGLGGRQLLDYGGGYGLLTRLMRDRGLDMRHHDPFARNLFAQGFDGDPGADYGAITMVEVFEHLTEPLALLRSLSPHAEMVIVSTQLVPAGLTDLSQWWYLIPELGQHVTFYTPRSLTEIGRRSEFRLASDGVGIHVFYRGRLNRLARLVLRDTRTAGVIARALRLRAGAKSLSALDAPAALASLGKRPT